VRSAPNCDVKLTRPVCKHEFDPLRVDIAEVEKTPIESYNLPDSVPVLFNDGRDFLDFLWLV